MITRLRLGYSHFGEHKFISNFQDTLNPLFAYSIEAESSSHWFLRWYFFDAFRNIDSDLPTLRDENLADILLCGNQIYGDKSNEIILMHEMRYIKDSQRFVETLFNSF